MKKAFSTQWKGSKQPRKQRKYRANAPLHIRRKIMSSNLTKELRKKYGTRNISVRKGDSVRIMTGAAKKKTGKVEQVDVKKMKITVEGIHRTKKDGTKIALWFDPSNVQIKELTLTDKKRTAIFERRKEQAKKEEKSEKISTKSTEKKQHASK